MWQIWNLVRMRGKTTKTEYVLYEGEIWKVEEKSKEGWLIISKDSRLVFVSKSDVDFCDMADDKTSPDCQNWNGLEW